jgi:hypothetical protein
MPTTPSQVTDWKGSKAEAFMKIQKPIIEACIIDIVTSCHDKSSDDEIRTRIRDLMSNELHVRIDKALFEADRALCLENGATLCLALIHLDRVFAVNIGDSSMICASPSAIVYS